MQELYCSGRTLPSWCWWLVEGVTKSPHNSELSLPQKEILTQIIRHKTPGWHLLGSNGLGISTI